MSILRITLFDGGAIILGKSHTLLPNLSVTLSWHETGGSGLGVRLSVHKLAHAVSYPTTDIWYPIVTHAKYKNKKTTHEKKKRNKTSRECLLDLSCHPGACPSPNVFA